MHSVWILGAAFALFALWMVGVETPWLVAGGLALLAGAFNSIVSGRNRADAAFSSVEVMLKKRYDLIPGLVDSVQRYLEHESEVLEEVIRLRAEALRGGLPPERAVELDGQIGAALSRIVATAEGYPELKASENFQQLQRALNEVEEQLSAARRSYNAAVQHYNDSLHMVPTSWIARIAGFRERPYFELPAGHAERPDVYARFQSHRDA